EAVVVKTAACCAAALSKTTVQTLVEALKVPRLKPTVCVASGPMEVSVAVTVPPVFVTNDATTAPTGFSSPENVSVVGTVVVGVVVVVVLPQALASARIAANTEPHTIRRSISSPDPGDRLCSNAEC